MIQPPKLIGLLMGLGGGYEGRALFYGIDNFDFGIRIKGMEYWVTLILTPWNENHKFFYSDDAGGKNGKKSPSFGTG